MKTVERPVSRGDRYDIAPAESANGRYKPEQIRKTAGGTADRFELAPRPLAHAARRATGEPTTTVLTKVR